jgi:hypothetical protein
MENFKKFSLMSDNHQITAIELDGADRLTTYSLDVFFERVVLNDIREGEIIYTYVDTLQKKQKIGIWKDLYPNLKINLNIYNGD